MSDLTPKKIIQARIEREEHFTELREKVGGLRRLIGGDLSYLAYGGVSSVTDGTVQMAANADTEESAVYRERTLIDEYKEGVSNESAVVIRTLVGQTSMKFPSIETEDLKPEHAAFHQAYLETLCAPAPVGCGALAHKRQGLVDYLIGGYSFTLVGMKRGVPSMSWLDITDVIWPHENPITEAFPWVAFRKRMTVAEWIRTYSREVMRKVIKGLKASDETDREIMHKTVVLICYYDDFGPQGTHALYDPGTREVILVEPSMYVSDINGNERAYTPVTMSAGLHIPGVLTPTTIAELILPTQAGLSSIQTAFNRFSKRTPFLDVERDAYHPNTIEAIKRGEDLPIAIREPGSPAAEARGYVEIPNALIQMHELYRQQMTQLSGANPYATGGVVEGIQYAAEVNAIQQQGALVATIVGSDHAQHWAQSIRLMLMLGERYHVAPFRLRVNEVEYEFGPEMPIGMVLAPDAAFTVREETLSASAQQVNLQKSLTVLQATMQVAGMGAVPPNAITAAYTDVLQAAGVRDVRRFLEPVPTLGGQMGAPAGAQSAEMNSTEGAQ